MNISNNREVMIFRFEENDKVNYTVGISKKKQGTEKEYDNAFYPIQFPKGVSLENKTKIMIKNAWLSFYDWEYENKKGTKFYIMCNEFDEIKEDPYADFGKSIDLEDYDNKSLPF